MGYEIIRKQLEEIRKNTSEDDEVRALVKSVYSPVDKGGIDEYWSDIDPTFAQRASRVVSSEEEDGESEDAED